MNKALIIIDIQNDYFKNGKFELVNADAALENARLLSDYFHENSWPVFLVQHISSKDGKFFIPETDGVNIHSKLCGCATDIVVKKNYPNSFLKTNLKEELDRRNIDELYVCGMMTHMCVDTTVRAAFDYGYRVKLFSDACATRDLSFQGKIMKAQTVQDVYMASLNNMFASVVTTDGLKS